MVLDKLRQQINEIEAKRKIKLKQKQQAKIHKKEVEFQKLKREEDQLLVELNRKKRLTDEAQKIKETKKEIKLLKEEVHPSRLKQLERLSVRLGKEILVKKHPAKKKGKKHKRKLMSNKQLNAKIRMLKHELALEKVHARRRKSLKSVS